MQDQKCVLVIDGGLPLGVAANVAAIIGITMGCKLPQVVGADVVDAVGRTHLGIIEFPVPILRGTAESIRELRARLYQPEFAGVTVVDFSELAQGCKTYGEYIDKMAQAADLQYLGLGLCGPRKLVGRLTGSLPLLR